MSKINNSSYAVNIFFNFVNDVMHYKYSNTVIILLYFSH